MHIDLHKHTHTPPHPLPVPTYWSRLLLLAACRLRKKRALILLLLSFSSLFLFLFRSLSLSCCQWNADDMTSSAKSLEKVITAHPHPYQIILFLVCSPAFQFIHHSISTSVPPSYSITFLPSYVPVQLTLHVWVYMHLSLGVSSQLTYLLPPKWSLLFQPLANRFTHINFQLSRTSIFFSGSALYPMWSQCRKAPLLLFILLQWVEVLSDTWGAWHTHSLYKESLIPSSQTHTCTCEHTHTGSPLTPWLNSWVCWSREEQRQCWGAASMMKSSERRADGSRLDCLHPLSFLLHPTHPLARAIFIFSSLTHPFALLIRSILNFQRMPWDTESLVSPNRGAF